MNSYRSREALPRGRFARGCDPRRSGAFTLLEILVCLAIIGLLAGLAIVNVGGIHRNAEETAARLMVRESLKIPLTLYRHSVGDYPSTAEGLEALAVAPNGKQDRWRGPYIEGKVPRDPWGEPFRYESPGRHNKDSYDLWSVGKDKQSGTADDIVNWE